jgi:hypothetical protein
MLILTSSIKNRATSLFSNSFHKETQGNLVSFDLDYIYDAMLVNKPDIVVLDRSDLYNIHVNNFMKEIVSNTVSIGNCKIIVLTTKKDDKKIQHNNIRYISSSTYYLFNEYYKHKDTITRDFKYLLCHLDCSNLSNNSHIEQLTYPNNSKVAVKLVGCSNVKHPQNLGTVTETEMLDLIYGCSVYINIDNQYVYDAMLLKKPIINFSSDIPELSVCKHTPSIDDATNNYDIANVNRNRISNLIKYILK